MSDWNDSQRRMRDDPEGRRPRLGGGTSPPASLTHPELPFPRSLPVAGSPVIFRGEAGDPAPVRTVLVVDDDDGCRGLLAEAFEALGCRSLQAADGGEALRLLSQHHLDLVCTDLMMAGVDGLEFVRLLCAQAPALPVAVISGCGDDAAVAEAARLGTLTWVRKPAGLAELAGILRRLPDPPADAAARGLPVLRPRASRPLRALDALLLHKTSQLSQLTQFASALCNAGGAGQSRLGSNTDRSSAGSQSGEVDPIAPLVRLSLDTILRTLGAEQAAFFLFDGGLIQPIATCGRRDVSPPAAEVVAQLRLEEGGSPWHGVIRGMEIVAVPLSIRAATVGFVCASRVGVGHPFTWSEAELLAAFVGQTAAALENASLARQLEQAFQASVTALIVALEAKHKYTEGHSLRVARDAAGIAGILGLSPVEREQINTAGLLHDLGKVGVRDDILDKPGPLTPLESASMRQHPILGGRILEKLEFLKEEAEIVRHHHERMDGSGYPDGLSGDAIPLAARIIAVADAFDAMRSARSYRPALPLAHALAELRRGAGVQFDREVVAAFCIWCESSSMSQSAA